MLSSCTPTAMPTKSSAYLGKLCKNVATIAHETCGLANGLPSMVGSILALVQLCSSHITFRPHLLDTRLIP